MASAFLNSGVTDKDSILDFLKKNYSDFGNYDIQWQNNTAQAIYNRIWQLSSQQNQDWLNTDIDPNLLNNANNTANWDYWNTVNSILKNAYWIGDLNQFKDMFGSEAYYSLLQWLQSTEWAWNATDPNSRQQLDWYIQGILWAGVWTAVEQSQLNLNKESILWNFSEDSRARLEQDLLDVQNLATRWYNLEQIADETGMSTDQVRQLVLLNQGQPSKIGEYYEMSSRAEDMITEDYDRARNNLMENYKANLERQNQQIEWLKQDFNEAFEKQQANNEANLHNIDMVMWMSWTWYSRRGMEWVGIAQRQAKWILDDLMNNYDRSNAEIGRMIQQLTMSYRQNDAELVDQINDALLQAKNNYIANTNAIQQKYGLVGLQWQQAMSQAVKDFCQQAENIYNNAFNRAWTNTNNLITAVSNIWAIQQQQIQTRQMKIAEFQQDSMYMTQQQLANYAQQNGLQMEYDQLVAYQQEATVGALTSAWLNGSKYFGQVQKMLAQWYTPQQALYKILNSPEAQAEIAQNGQNGNRSISGDYMYDKNTGEVRNLAQMMNGGGYSWQDTSVASDPYTYTKVDLLNGQSVSKWDTINVWDNTWTITQIWGSQTWGVDFAPSVPWTHDPIPAFESWTVVRKGTDTSWNNYIEILNDNGYVYRYNHLESVPSIKVWQQVQAGDIIAKMWNSGKVKWATWVHLDLAVYDWSRANSTSVSPLDQATQTRIIFGGNTSASWWDEAQKQIYLEQVRRWMITNTDITKIWQLAAEQWWWNEFREAMNEWLKVSLTERQQWIKNTADTKFTNNAIVKEFENSINQIEQLTTALNDKSWAWDMSAIFTFMKTLDPNSVVRESEFEAAANTAWLAQKAQVIFKKLTNWQKLSADQRESFKKIAIEFIKTKAQNYNIKYDELRKTYSNAQIDEQWLPTNMADIVLQQLWVTGSWSSTTSTSSWWRRWL